MTPPFFNNIGISSNYPQNSFDYGQLPADKERLKKNAILIFDMANTEKAKNGDEEVLDSNELSGMNSKLLPFLRNNSGEPYKKSEFLQDYMNYNSQISANETSVQLTNVISDKILSMDLDSAKKFILENPKYIIYLNSDATDRIRDILSKDEMETLLNNWPSENEI